MHDQSYTRLVLVVSLNIFIHQKHIHHSQKTHTLDRCLFITIFFLFCVHAFLFHSNKKKLKTKNHLQDNRVRRFFSKILYTNNKKCFRLKFFWFSIFFSHCGMLLSSCSFFSHSIKYEWGLPLQVCC